MESPSNLCMQRRSPKRYTGYMALMIELVETKPSSFEEAVEKIVWVDSMVEEYESIVNNSVWEVVPRPANKLGVCLRWIFKVNHESYGSTGKYKAMFVAKGFSQIEGN